MIYYCTLCQIFQIQHQAIQCRCDTVSVVFHISIDICPITLHATRMSLFHYQIVTGPFATVHEPSPIPDTAQYRIDPRILTPYSV